MMNVSMTPGGDPLGLRDLPEPKPEAERLEQDWAVVSEALDRRARRRRQAWMGGLAAAASIAFVIVFVGLPGPGLVDAPGSAPMTADTGNVGGDEASSPPDAGQQAPPRQPSAEELMAMSQDAERQLRQLRARVGSMPSRAVVYQVELQDLISQVDDALSLSPDSAELWGQRLSLQLDLMKLYSGQLRRDYVRMASL